MKSNLKSDPSSFWQYVNSKKSTDNIPKTMRFGEVKTSSEQEQANLFANFFGSNYSTNNMATSDQPSPPSENTSCFQLDLDFVMTEMTRVNTKKGVGPDGIHPLILKECASTLAKPLTKLLNESLASGIFPEEWKRSSVSPIFKKGARSDIENYRCIAKLPTIAKFFEHLVNVNLLEIVRDRISLNQHGFMKGRSTASNLTEFVYYAQSGLNVGAQVDVLYTDFTKAFDRVDHNILIHKLRSFNLPQNLLDWLKSYLENRVQFVKHGASESKNFTAASGVPQGSHLGPTLFLLFINDIVDQMPPDIMILLFADDIKIAKIIKSQQDAELLQQAIDKLKLWCDQNKLHLNLKKCAVLSIFKKRQHMNVNYTYGDHTFDKVTEHKDLGVLIDRKLLFAKHIDMVTSKATAALGFVKRFCHDINDVTTLKSLYYALVQSHLEYCSTVWQPFHKIHKDKIESVQRQFTMYARREYPSIHNQFTITPYEQRLSELSMISLRRRRINSSLVFFYDIVNGSANCPSVRNKITLNTGRSLRRSEHYMVNDKRMKLVREAPIPQMCKMANMVPELFTSATSKTCFVSSVRRATDADFGSLCKLK